MVQIFRILAVGWDQQVTEFNDIEGREYGEPKKWPIFHTDDITCADAKLGEGVVTATYSGELVFWKLETGQPYRRYSVANPTEFIKLKHSTAPSSEDIRTEDLQQTRNINVSRFVRKSVSEAIRDVQKSSRKLDIREEKQNLVGCNQTTLRRTLTQVETLPMSVQAVLFLQTRPMTKEHGR